MISFKPHKYQEIAINTILEHEAVGLFLDMGLGKTISTLTALVELMYDYFETKKILVIAPKLVASTTWSDEVEKWAELENKFKISKILGSKDQRLKALYDRDANLFLINRENVVWLVEELGAKWFFDTLVIDELSSFKSPSSKRFRALRKVRPLCKRVIGLTGTPAPNGLMDLWSEMYLLDKGERLGKTLTAYRDKYFKPGRRNGHIIFDWVLKDGAEEAIWDAIADITISMKAVDWLDMPSMIDIVKSIELDKEAKAKYDKLKKDMVLQLSSDVITVDTAAILGNKLLQMANGNVYTEDGKVEHIHAGKLDALEELVEEANGEKVLVFYNYKHDKDAILERFPKATLLKDETSIKKFKESKDGGIYLASPLSVGHGLNLAVGGHINIWYGLTWNLEAYLQACARLHRQGQTKTVMNYLLITKDTIDEDVYKAISTKANTQEALMQAIKERMGLSAEMFRR